MRSTPPLHQIMFTLSRFVSFCSVCFMPRLPMFRMLSMFLEAKRAPKWKQFGSWIVENVVWNGLWKTKRQKHVWKVTRSLCCKNTFARGCWGNVFFQIPDASQIYLSLFVHSPNASKARSGGLAVLCAPCRWDLVVLPPQLLLRCCLQKTHRQP